MPTTILTARERPDLAERARDLTADVWPEYNAHGVVPLRYWPGLYDVFPEFQYVLYDEDGDDVMAEGHSLPLVWDGTAAGLPAGIDGAMAAAFDLREAGGEANTLCAMAIEIPPRHQRQGLSRTMISAMARIAADRGLGDLIAPVRPSAKERYPLTPIERYASWTREDGLPFDPWMPGPCAGGWREPATRAEVPLHRGQRRQVGGLDRDGVPGERRLRVSARPRAANDRSRPRRRPLLGAQRLDAPPGRPMTPGRSATARTGVRGGRAAADESSAASTR